MFIMSILPKLILQLRSVMSFLLENDVNTRNRDIIYYKMRYTFGLLLILLFM